MTNKQKKAKSKPRLAGQGAQQQSLGGRVANLRLSPASQVLGKVRTVERPVFDQASADDDYLTVPDIRAVKPQHLEKADCFEATFAAKHCAVDSEFAASKGYDRAVKILWVPPYNVHWNNRASIGADTSKGDARGTFVDIGSTRIRVKNVYSQPIRIAFNSPRGRVEDPKKAYVRRYKKLVTIQPGKTKDFRLGWGDHANIFTPMVCSIPLSATGSAYMPGFEVLDFLVIAPDVNLESGKPLRATKERTDNNKTIIEMAYNDQENLEVAKFSFEQRYLSSAQYAGTIEVEERKAVYLAKVKDAADFLNEATVEAPIAAVTLVAGVHKGAAAMLDAQGAPWEIGYVDGTFFTCMGTTFIVEEGLVRPCDPLTREPLDRADVVIPAGVTFQLLAGDYFINWNDILGYITTVTRVLSVASAVIGAFV